MSWKPEPKFYPNGLRFATKEESDTYALDLSMRWLAVIEWRSVESNDPVTHEISSGLLKRIDEPEVTE